MKEKDTDKASPTTNPCKQCGSKDIYRSFNLVDGDWLDDGCFCNNCNEWVEDPD